MWQPREENLLQVYWRFTIFMGGVKSAETVAELTGPRRVAARLRRLTPERFAFTC